MLQDIESGKNAQVEAVLEVIAAAHPDVLVLTDFDWDLRGRALAALRARLAARGLDYPFSFAPQPNTGVDTGFDVDGNGVLAEPRDAQGYGEFTGQHGMAALSRLPIMAGQARNFTPFLWQDLPQGQMEAANLPAGLGAVQRLSSAGHWDLPVETNAGPLHLWVWAATPPVFDGPEDRNGKRNGDENLFWLRYLDGLLPLRPAAAPFVALGKANIDPAQGEGQHPALQALLSDARLQDPLARYGPTADFGGTLGPMRVDYALPSADLRVRDAGVMAPGAVDEGLSASVQAASRHWLLWVEIDRP